MVDMKSKFLALKAAGFTNRDIIEAYKEGRLADLLALVEESFDIEGQAKIFAADLMNAR